MANETYKLISAVTVGSGGAASIDFTSIPQTYTDLKLVISPRDAYAGPFDGIKLTFNGNTTGYSERYLQGTGTATASGSSSGNAFGSGGTGNAATSTASIFGNIEIYIPNYIGATNKSFSTDSVAENNATATQMLLYANLWSNTSAITSISLAPYQPVNFSQYSTAYLYGIANTAGTDALFPVEYLVIAGGGGGGGASQNSAGAGGAGGYRSSVPGQSSGGGASAEPLLSLFKGTSYTVTVGGGGSGAGGYGVGGNGNPSVLGSITSTGGGGGGSQNPGGNPGNAGQSGGSGGGGSYIANGGAGTANQGFAGANFPGGGAFFGGGGGAGSAGSGSTAGAGVSSNITGTAVTRGVGGTGASNAGGAANTGNGGGSSTGGGAGQSGGSGIVILRYANTNPDLTSVSGGLTYTLTNTGGYKIYTFTAGTGTITV